MVGRAGGWEAVKEAVGGSGEGKGGAAVREEVDLGEAGLGGEAAKGVAVRGAAGVEGGRVGAGLGAAEEGTVGAEGVGLVGEACRSPPACYLIAHTCTRTIVWYVVVPALLPSMIHIAIPEYRRPHKNFHDLTLKPLFLQVTLIFCLQLELIYTSRLYQNVCFHLHSARRGGGGGGG